MKTFICFLLLVTVSLARVAINRCGPVCPTFCLTGHKADENGCPTCFCNQAPVELTQCHTSGMYCRILCPNGMVKDKDGCPLCQCLP
ncbi:antistasin-like [Gigantopelta aegis]|uniref:antistasin-like n=1 Tax=Gigantopelta aegis TaxID=1735272 RepID=UPI001B88E09A|nr:antistasin-like [Gigantopelta aegis]